MASKTLFLSTLVGLCLNLPLNAQQQYYVESTHTKTVDRIAFGSCARERQEQPIWDHIQATDPDLFLFIGDNQYADFWEKDGTVQMTPVEHPNRFDEAYKMLAQKPGFKSLSSKTPIMATWDDHDYGANDGGAEFPLKEESQRAFMDFFGVQQEDPMRDQEGIYHARTFGPQGQRVQVIMLDTRYHRDALTDRPGGRTDGVGPYIPTKDTKSTLLGEKQWIWLASELKKPADVRIVVSSIQVVANQHGWEMWGNMPHERQRLFDLIRDTKANGVVFLSGDRHLMEISRDAGQSGGKVPYTIWDFTSSGLTQRAGEVNDPNRFRVGPALRENNFGVVEIHWGDSAKDTAIDLIAYGGEGQLLTRQSVFLSELMTR